LVIVLLAALAAVCAADGYPDPTRFEKAIAAFAAADSLRPPPQGAIVAVGSSSMRGWHRRIHEDLAPLTIVPRGFGGSTMKDVLHYANRVVLTHAPRAVLLYEGDNDVAAGIDPQQIRSVFDSLVAEIRSSYPRPRIYVISVKPSPSRWHLWPAMAATNRLLRQACDQAGWLTFIDVAGPMLNDRGVPRPEIFRSDSLHMNDVGYDTWSDVVGPLLREREAVFEGTSSWSDVDRDGVFESGIPPGEGGGRFRSPPHEVPLYQAPSARAQIATTSSFPPGELEYDEVRYRTRRPGLLVAKEPGHLSGTGSLLYATWHYM
jgi:lysophospholipase L1-like esterase